jgi:hypothetical protein
MHPTLAGWERWDFREANRHLAALGDLPGITEEDLVQALALAPAIKQRFTDSSHVEQRGQRISWYHYETLLWTLGETFRRQLKRHRSFRRRPSLFTAITAFCEDRGYGKGRESFTLLLGQYGGPATAPVLLRLLGDPDVHGHALYALRLLGDPAGIPVAHSLLTSPRSWVRGEARKYLAKVAGRPGTRE